MISPLPLFVTLISRSEYLVVNSFPPLLPIVPFFLSDRHTHSHSAALSRAQVRTSHPVSLPELSEESDF